MAGGIGGIFERLFTGRDFGQDLSKYNNIFKSAYNSGTALTDSSLGDLRNLSGGYQRQIDAGGLTPALNREYDVQGGKISDDAARAGRSFRANLGQQAAQNGGFLSQAAQAELATRNEAGVNENTFTARNNLAFDKARVSQAATSELQDRILKVADMIRTTGLSREQQAQMGALNILGLQYQRNKAISDAARSWFSVVGGGTGGAGGGG